MGWVSAVILRELKASGHHVSAQLMNAMYYGVLQSRQRMISIGGRICGTSFGADDCPVACGESLAGCSTPQDQLDALFEAGRKYRSFKYCDKARIGSSESHITGQGSKAVKFDPNKPVRTIRRNDGNLGTHGAMHWSEKRRFSLPEFKRFGSFPDAFTFAGEFEEVIRQIGNSVPPLFMRAISQFVRYNILQSI